MVLRTMIFVAIATCVASIVATNCDGKDGACQVGASQFLQMDQTNLVSANRVVGGQSGLKMKWVPYSLCMQGSKSCQTGYTLIEKDEEGKGATGCETSAMVFESEMFLEVVATLGGELKSISWDPDGSGRGVCKMANKVGTDGYAACVAGYILGEQGTESCPTGYTLIEKDEEGKGAAGCEIAVNTLEEVDATNVGKWKSISWDPDGSGSVCKCTKKGVCKMANKVGTDGYAVCELDEVCLKQYLS